MTSYDIIGDIHGHADELIILLEKLGYSNKSGYYRHPARTVLFLGDFIDRGSDNRKTLEIVMNMVKRGTAKAVMGNHEYNAICYHTRHPASNLPLRTHSEGNTRQHQAFLDEFPYGSEATHCIIEWFKSLPLFLDLGGLRVIHACWDATLVDWAKQKLTDNYQMDETFLVRSTEKSTLENDAISILLKGPEISLPSGYFFRDKEGKQRRRVRLKWWRSLQSTYRDCSLVPPSEQINIPDFPINSNTGACGYQDGDKPVFFGHYWFGNIPEPVRPNAACLDYSVAAHGGKLCAYRWDGEQTLVADRFVAVAR